MVSRAEARIVKLDFKTNTRKTMTKDRKTFGFSPIVILPPFTTMQVKLVPVFEGKAIAIFVSLNGHLNFVFLLSGIGFPCHIHVGLITDIVHF